MGESKSDPGSLEGLTDPDVRRAEWHWLKLALKVHVAISPDNDEMKALFAMKCVKVTDQRACSTDGRRVHVVPNIQLGVKPGLYDRHGVLQRGERYPNIDSVTPAGIGKTIDDLRPTFKLIGGRMVWIWRADDGDWCMVEERHVSDALLMDPGRSKVRVVSPTALGPVRINLVDGRYAVLMPLRG